MLSCKVRTFVVKVIEQGRETPWGYTVIDVLYDEQSMSECNFLWDGFINAVLFADSDLAAF